MPEPPPAAAAELIVPGPAAADVPEPPPVAAAELIVPPAVAPAGAAPVLPREGVL
jgi:hypothetical protein